MELTGTIIAVMPAQSGVSARTGNPWMSQEYVIEVPGQYPKKCVFRIFGEDRIKQFNIQQGVTGTVQFDIDAHEYNGRWFNEVRAYNFVYQVQQQGTAQPQPQPQPQTQRPVQQPAPQPQGTAPFPPPQPEQGDAGGSADDLPFE